MIRLALLLWLSVAAVLAAPPAAGGPSGADREIRFWEARLPRDPDDFVAPTRLGAAYLQKARESGDFAYYLKAEEALRTALKRAPEHPPAMAFLSEAFAAQHRFHEAITLAETVVRHQPGDPHGYGILGDASLQMGDIRRAQLAYDRLTHLAPHHFAWGRMANLQHLRGDTTGALASLRRALTDARSRNAPRESVAWCLIRMGIMEFDRGRWKEAGEHYRNALRLLPDSHLALKHLAELRAAEKKYPQARSLYEKVIRLAPHPEYLEALGDVHEAMGSTAQARKWRLRALQDYRDQVSRGNAGYFRRLAMFHADRLKDGKGAVEWAEKDLQIRQDVYAYDTLGWALYRLGRLPHAAAAARKSLVLGTRDARLFYHAGMIYAALGRRSEARLYLQKALRTNPRMPEAAEVRKALQKAGA